MIRKVINKGTEMVLPSDYPYDDIDECLEECDLDDDMACFHACEPHDEDELRDDGIEDDRENWEE